MSLELSEELRNLSRERKRDENKKTTMKRKKLKRENPLKLSDGRTKQMKEKSKESEIRGAESKREQIFVIKSIS